MPGKLQKLGGKQVKRADRLLLMIAAYGELPAGSVPWVMESPSYAAALITRLKKEGKIGVRNADRLKGYVLYQNGRDHLMKVYPELSAFFLDYGGNAAKSEPDKRLRIHRMAQALCFLYGQGVSVFGGKTAILSGLDYDMQVRGEQYIPSVQLKRYLAKEAGGSRACGVWVVDAMAYCVYNSMNSLMRWTARTEWVFRMRAQQGCCKRRG